LINPPILSDESFADNSLVAGDPKIRFYAGIPLHTSSGNTVPGRHQGARIQRSGPGGSQWTRTRGV